MGNRKRKKGLASLSSSSCIYPLCYLHLDTDLLYFSIDMRRPRQPKAEFILDLRFQRGRVHDGGGRR